MALSALLSVMACGILIKPSTPKIRTLIAAALVSLSYFVLYNGDKTTSHHITLQAHLLVKQWISGIWSGFKFVRFIEIKIFLKYPISVLMSVNKAKKKVFLIKDTKNKGSRHLSTSLDVIAAGSEPAKRFECAMCTSVCWVSETPH